jgi:hypothetical protein
MKDETRTLSVWMGLGLLIVVGVFVVLLGQAGHWWDWQGMAQNMGMNSHGSSPPVMDGNGQSEDAASLSDSPAADLRATHEAMADRLLEALRRRVQSVGAIENEALLTFKSADALQAFLKRAGLYGLRPLGEIDRLNAVRVGYDDLEKLRADLLDHGEDYADVSANYLVKVPGLPPKENRVGGDAPFGDSVMAAMGANIDRTNYGQNVKVAVIDTGVADHPTFRPNQVLHTDLVKDGQPFDGHGTAMASLVAGGKYGAEGLAPAATILDIRVADARGESDSFILAQGIYSALDQGANIINISLASYGDAMILREAIKAANERGVTVFAAVGNEQAGVKAYPAAYPDVVSVSGIDAQLHLAYFSNSGDPTIAAPAVSIPSAYVDSGKTAYVLGDGTSQASALAAGMGAVFRSWGFDVPSALTSRARSTGAAAREVGAGVLNLGPPR